MLKINDIVTHSTLGDFKVIGASDKKTICQSISGKIYSLATAHLFLRDFNFPKPNVWAHYVNR